MAAANKSSYDTTINDVVLDLTIIAIPLSITTIKIALIKIIL